MIIIALFFIIIDFSRAVLKFSIEIPSFINGITIILKVHALMAFLSC
ncbi:MAG: hypothetical protein ACTSYS_12985 [Promethearchaeota archaeon]